ncbi:alpha-amylase family glycosyl hydrolase [Arenibaculum pallidiluteum]|uniref:alpha-amylase family glycosyl hydrolase n=1 Tax=Arenibaculum pallidiluteum TaxID=2812559 RepID=UPI001A96AE3C|nr:alpha-amylase family glycosyl hydrolase [Arenibaculum pallidiluteum]
MSDGHAWWQRGVVYQVYPRSFQDSDGDGIGDLRGITARLDHLVDLGVDAVWISPIYPSPMADFGYDVADHTGIDPAFGTLEEFDRLVAEAHGRGLRVILDYVPNHTSDRHPWFAASRSSRTDPLRDWYVWRDPAPDGGPPNNWVAEFGGSAWEWDERTGQYYYHAYLKEQPDLNWRNPAVREAMLNVLRFWLRRGVDGFRVDAIHHLVEDERLRDNPPSPDWRPGMSPARRLVRAHTMDQPEVHEAIAAMRRAVEEFPGDRLLIGEAYLPIDRLMAYYGIDLAGFHLPFNFHLISTPWKAAAVAALIDAYEAALPPGGWPNWVLGNHDRSRVASRIGPAQARVASMLLLTLRGTPTIYQGDEIGMLDVAIPPDLVQDPWERNLPGLGLGRDPVRAPLPWAAGPGAGFTTGAPWLPLPPDHARTNVAAQDADPFSMLALVKALLRLRRAEPALSVGDYVPVGAIGDVLVYERRHGGERFRIVLNMGSAPCEIPSGPLTGHIRLSTGLGRVNEPIGRTISLGPDEGLVIACEG